MSLITFRDRNTKGDPVGPTWYLEFDAATVEEFTRSAEVTTYPVETGAILSDHYQPQPRQISLRGVVSDTPSGPWTNLDGMQNAAAPPAMAKQPLRLQVKPDQRGVGRAGVLRPVVTGPLPSRRLVRANIERARLEIPKIVYILQATTPANRVTSFFEIIDGLMEQRYPVSVIMLDGLEFVDMMITNHVAPRVSGSGGAVTFSLDLQQIIAADPAESTKAAAQRAEPDTQPRKNRGQKNPKPPEKNDLARFERSVRQSIESFGTPVMSVP